MYTALGLITVTIGIVTLLFLPDTPMTAAFLSQDEKVLAIRRVGDNKTGIENRKFKWSHVKELLLDVQVILLILVTMLVRSYRMTSRGDKLADAFFFFFFCSLADGDF